MSDELSLATSVPSAAPGDDQSGTLIAALARHLLPPEEAGAPAQPNAKAAEPAPAEEAGAPAQPNAKAEEPAPANEQQPEPDDAPDDKARQRMQSAATEYTGGGRAATESNFYGRVGVAHSGSGSIYYNYYGAAQPDGKSYSVERILQVYLEKAAAVYVPPQLHDQARQRLVANYVLILGGQTGGTGRYTAALRLLADLPSAEMFEVSPNVDLDDPKAFTVERRCSYLIENFAPDRARALNGALLRRLHGQLANANSHMILTLHPNTSIEPDALGEYVLAWNDQPDCEAVLRKHVNWYSGGQAYLPAALGYCGEADVQKAYRDQPPAQLDRLAQLLAAAARGEFSLADALAQFRFNARKRVDDWFDRHPDLEQRTLMLAVAVFHGGRYSNAAAADKHLLELIKLPPPSDAPPPPPPIFEQSGTARLNIVGARLERKPERGGADASVIERVFLEIPALQPAVVQYVWDEFAGLRDPLLKWLAALGESDDAETRDRAAGAIGELAKNDFSAIFTGIIEPNAGSDNARARNLAAVALGILVAQKELAPQTLARLHDWSEGSSRWLRWTAALTYGLFVGREYPAEALWNLNAIVRSQNQSIVNLVRNSVADIFAIGGLAPDYYFRVIEALWSWASDSKSSALKAVWLDIFARIAGAKHRSPGQAAQPALLWIYSEYLSYRGIICGLMRMALNIYAPRQAALAALRGWLCAADDRPEIYPTLERFARDLLAESNAAEQERLRYWLARWNRDPKQPCESAGRIGAAVGNGLQAKEAQA